MKGIKEIYKLNFGKSLISALSVFVILLLSSSQIMATTYTSITNGNWTTASTWQGGSVPPTGDIPSSAVINIRHTVDYNSGDDIKNFGEIRIEPIVGTTAKLIIPDGINVENMAGSNMYVINAYFLQYRFDGGGDSGTQRSGNFYNRGYLEVIGSIVEAAQDWVSENNGERYFENSCLLVGENYQITSSGNNDTYRNVNLSIGWHGSGNFQLSDGEIDFNEMKVQLAGTSGNFQLSSGMAYGDIDFITMKNHATSNTSDGVIQLSSSLNVSTGLNLDAYWTSDPSKYEPNGKFSGTQTRTDLTSIYFPGGCNPGIVVVGPTAVDDNATTPMNTPVDITEMANDIIGDANLDPTSIEFVGTPPNPSTEGTFTVDPNTGLVTFTPVNGFVGTASVNYKVCDLNALCDVATIIVVVNSVNGPTAVNDTVTTEINTPVDITELVNDIAGDAALDPTSVSFIPGTEPDAGTEGTFTVDPVTGIVTFTPVNGFAGTASINYKVCDLNALCDVATIVVVVNPLNGPTAVNDNVTTQINTPVDITELANDIAGDAALDPTSVTFIPGTEPDAGTEGTFTVDPTTGLVTFTPVAIFTGTTTIDYQVCDLNLLCSTATITVFISSGTDTDGDGCADEVDEYPNDATRCFDIYYPAAGNGTLAYEDLWPSKGDYDFNDLVIEYRFKTVMSGSNNIVETFSTFVVRAFGASYENGFAYQFANDNIADEDILGVSGYDLQEGYVTLEANGIEQGQSIPTIFVYDNAFNIMAHPGQGIGVNTEPWAPYVQPDTLNMYMSFTQNKYTYAQLDIPNFNPFIVVNKNRGTEVHLPDYPNTDLANELQFGSWEDNSDPTIGRYYKTISNLPWAINIPEPFEYPVEKQDIIWVHLKFAEWAESGGTLFQDWYKDLSGYRNSSLIYSDQP